MQIDTEFLSGLDSRLQDNPTAINDEEKKKFWRMVGFLKRQDSPDTEQIQLMSNIREHLYSKKLGNPKPLLPIIVLNTLAAAILIYSVFLIYFNDIWVGTVVSWIPFFIFTYVYVWIFDFQRRFVVVAIFINIILIIGLDLILIQFDDLYLKLASYILIPVLPMLYLHGRYAGALIAGVKIDGVNRDVFYLPTLKLNYQSYLSARPDKRQWIFFCGGIGTVFTSTCMGILGVLFFDNPYLFIVPALLFVGELLDYTGLAGKLSGGEFAHLRREHRIIKDWKASLK